MAFLRSFALSAIGLGAVCSIGFMLAVGHSNLVLTSMFFVWVAAPFAGLVWAAGKSRLWPEPMPTTLYVTAILVAAASAYLYGDIALHAGRPQPAARFLFVPVVSWVILLTSFFVSKARIPRR